MRILIATLLLILSVPAWAQANAAPPVIPVPPSVSAEAQAYLRNLKQRPAVVANYNDPETMRRLRDGLDRMFLTLSRRITTEYELEKIDANGATAFWVRTGSPVHRDKVILYMHGGGYILGSATSNLGLPLRIGPAAGTPVLSVEYRLAPEHPFPAALDDSLAAYRWLLAHGHRGKDIALMGDSAGGGLAVALALAIKDAKLPAPAAIAALSPLTDLSLSSDTRATLAAVDPLVVGDSTERLGLYAGKHDVRDPLISPVYGDLRGLPPLLIQVGTREVLLSDAARLARRAREGGVDVRLDVWEGMWHVWQTDSEVPEAKQASVEIGRFLEHHLIGAR